MHILLNRRITNLKKQIKFAIIAAVFYIIGIIIGIVYSKSKVHDGAFYRSVFNFYQRIFDSHSKPISTFWLRFLIDFGYTAIIFVFGLSIVLAPLNFLLIAYRGAIVGCVGGIFISLYGFNGCAVFIAVVVPQNLIVTVGIIVSGLLNFADNLDKCLPKENKIKEILINCAIGFLIMIVGALYEFLITVVLLRPMNFYF